METDEKATAEKNEQTIKDVLDLKVDSEVKFIVQLSGGPIPQKKEFTTTVKELVVGTLDITVTFNIPGTTHDFTVVFMEEQDDIAEGIKKTKKCKMDFTWEPSLQAYI